MNIPNNTQIEILASGQANTTNVFFARVTVSGNTVVTIVPVASTKQIDIGRPTVDLPIVDVFVVNQAGGVALNQGMPYMPNTNLPNGTRVKETGFSGPFQAGDPRNNMIEVEVVDGPLTSTIGWLSHTVLTQEVRGTR